MVAAAPLSAKIADLAIPAGTLEEVAIAVARETNSSIVIADPALARRKVPGISGRMDATAAVRRIARASGLRAIKVGPGAWRLVEAEPRSQPRSAAARARAPASAPVRSVPPPETQGEPITVIASKRDLALVDLAAQVSLIDGEALQRGGVGGTERIMQRVASVSSTYLGSGRNKLFIRGIADSSFTGPTQATVGQYFGDLRLSYNAPDPDLRLSDMERVEILEGPQGTLYGAGSLGGIIRLVPRAPQPGEASLTVLGGASATQRGEPGGDVHATLNLPVAGERATLRANIDLASLGGYIDKPLIGRTNVNRTQVLSGRAALRVDIAPGWTVDMIALGQDTDAADSQYADRFGERLENSARVVEGSDAEYAQAQLVVTGDIGALRFKSSTGVAGQDLSERYDATAPAGPPRLFTQRNETRMIANETRLWQPLGDRFGWVLGASLVDNSTTLTRAIGVEGEEFASTGVRNDVFEITGYGEASYRITPALTATAGLRVTHVELGGGGEDVAPLIEIAGAAITAKRRETAYLPSAALLADIGAQARLYVRYQEGFRPGGLAVAGDFVRQFRSDHARTIELGGGWGLPGRGDFDLAASLSYTDWRDIQADFIDDGGLPTTANIGNGKIWTASLSGSVRLAAGLRAEFGGTLNDSDVTEPAFATLERLSRIPNIARFSGRAGLVWQRDFVDGTGLLFDGWVSYVGKSRLGIGPELGDLQGDYLDSGVIVRFGRENAGVSLTLTNLADSEGNRFALGTPFSTGREQITPLQPRTVRIGFDSRF
jgi:outer membrane receptor protein involved in Fe transport